MKHLLIVLAVLLTSGCAATIDKLEKVGKQPEFNAMDNPQTKADYKPVSWPIPNPEPPAPQYANSLWQPGARAFFRDQRAARVGDILRVKIEIKDKAELDNETQKDRDSSENVAVPDRFGSVRGKILPSNKNEDLLGITTASTNKGTGTIDREEKINTQVAALVTQVLPNGNLVIEGSQEIRVNFEIREVSIKGVIRPEDIGSDNTIDSSQVAEARINYGGRGQITDVQQPRWGSQVVDAISPF